MRRAASRKGKEIVQIVEQERILHPPRPLQIFESNELRQLSQGTPLSVGGFSKVFKADLHGKEVVIKKYCLGVDFLKQFEAEKRHLPLMDSPYIVNLIGYSNAQEIIEEPEQGGRPTNIGYLVLDYYPHCLHNTYYDFQWNDAMRVLHQLAKGLEYIHLRGESKLVFVDLKPSNVLLDEEGNVKICDFGAIIQENECLNAVTKGYNAPETNLITPTLKQSVDSYSFGVIMLQILMKEDVFQQLSPPRSKKKGKKKDVHIAEKARQIKESRVHFVHKAFFTSGCNEEAAKELSTLALQCVSLYERARPSMSEIVKRLEEIKEPTQKINEENKEKSKKTKGKQKRK